MADEESATKAKGRIHSRKGRIIRWKGRIKSEMGRITPILQKNDVTREAVYMKKRAFSVFGVHSRLFSFALMKIVEFE